MADSSQTAAPVIPHTGEAPRSYAAQKPRLPQRGKAPRRKRDQQALLTRVTPGRDPLCKLGSRTMPGGRSAPSPGRRTLPPSPQQPREPKALQGAAALQAEPAASCPDPGGQAAGWALPTPRPGITSRYGPPESPQETSLRFTVLPAGTCLLVAALAAELKRRAHGGRRQVEAEPWLLSHCWQPTKELRQRQPTPPMTHTPAPVRR